MSNNSNQRRILFLSANPRETSNLRLEEERREIEERLRLAGYGKQPIYSSGATRTRDMQQAMIDYKPNVLHFSGHGTGEDGLVFEDTDGQIKLLSTSALADFAKLFSERGLECIFLNACYSKSQAEAMVQYIPYVIGMSQVISDKAAIEFAVGFYTALGGGESIKFAYRLGCNSMQLAGIPGHLTPVIFEKEKSVDIENPIKHISLNIYPAGSPDVPEPVTEEKLQIALNGSLSKWKKVITPLPEDSSKLRVEIFREYKFKTFVDAIEFMKIMAPGCDIAHHHPRWENIWRTLKVYLTTWDIDHQISDRDIQLAKYFDEAFSNFSGSDKEK